MKLLTFYGPGRYLEVPGHFTLALGESHEVDDHLAETLVSANPNVRLLIDDLPAKRAGAKRRASDGERSQPEAQEGEGQPSATDPQEE